MRQNLSALDNRLKGAGISKSLRALGSAGLLAFGLGTTIFGAYQIFSLVRYHAEQKRTESIAQEQAAALGNWLRDDKATLERIAADPSTVAAASGDKGQQNELVTSIITNHGYDRALLLPPRVNQLEPEPYPGADYAALAVGILAQSTYKVSDPLYTAGANHGRFHWAAPVLDDRTVLGLLVVTRSAEPIVGAMEAAARGGGYIDLRNRSVRNQIQVLTAFGTPIGFGTSGTLEVTSQFGFAIGYANAEPFGLIGTNWGAVAVWPLLGILLLLGAYVARYGIPKPKLTKPASEDDEEDTSADVVEEVEADLREAMNFADKDAATSGRPAPAAITESMFRAYDIRGTVGDTLSDDTARMIGQAIGSEARAREVSEVVVARDGRHSGPSLQQALIEGINAAGVDVVDIGAVPTGVLYFATHHLGTGSGVMVTGSHNPPEYNGFKIMLGGETLAGDAITDLYRRITEGDLASGEGGAQETSVIEEYVDYIASDIQVEEPLKVVVDCGNGIPGMIAPRVIEEIGCEVVPLFCEVDGDFPNHHPDPSVPQNLVDLITSVKSLDADLGVAFDGDGDRLGVVTREGKIIFSDRILMLFAEDVLLRNPGATVIYDVKCTNHLARVILQNGGSPLMWKTGHSFMKAKMKETGAALGGEMSGHFFFQERWFGFDDGIYAAARLLEILAAEPDGGLEKLTSLPDSISTPELKVEMAEGEHFAFMEKFAAHAQFDDARLTTIDGVRADYDDGWGLVRCSNTTPCLVIRFDAQSQAALERIREAFRKQLLKVNRRLKLPF